MGKKYWIEILHDKTSPPANFLATIIFGLNYHSCPFCTWSFNSLWILAVTISRTVTNFIDAQFVWMKMIRGGCL